MISIRLKKIKDRHGLSLAKSLAYEIYIKLYRYNPKFRTLFQLFTKTKKPKQVFFLIGAYNSGTTIIKNTISTHPDVSIAPIEGDLLTSEISNMEEGGWHRCLYGNKDSINEYRDEVTINPKQLLKDWSPWIKEDKYFLEKSIANSVRISQLRKAFPGCKFINVIRAPDGVINGIKKRSKPTGDASKQLNSDTYPDELLYCQWSYIYGLIESDSKSKDTYNCSYENFIANPESSTKSLFKFLELKTISLKLNSNILSIGANDIYIRPLPENTNIIDYGNTDLRVSEIKRLKCD